MLLAGQVTRLIRSGEVPSQKWMNFYTRVLSRFAVGKGLGLTVTAEIIDPAGISQQKIDETKIVLHKTIESVLQRGEKIDDLVAKSDGLSAQSKMFYREWRIVPPRLLPPSPLPGGQTCMNRADTD